MSICRWLLQLCNPFHDNVHWTLSARKGFWGSVPHSQYYAVTSSWCNFSVKPCISMPCRHLQIRLVLLWLYPQPKAMQFAKIHLKLRTGIESWSHYLHFKSLTFPKSSWRWTMCPFDSCQKFQILRLASYDRPWNTCTSVGLCTGTGDGNRGQGSWEDGRPAVSGAALGLEARERGFGSKRVPWLCCISNAEGNLVHYLYLFRAFYILICALWCFHVLRLLGTKPRHMKVTDLGLAKLIIGKTYTTSWALKFSVQFVISPEIHRELSRYLCFGVSISMDV